MEPIRLSLQRKHLIRTGRHNESLVLDVIVAGPGRGDGCCVA